MRPLLRPLIHHLHHVRSRPRPLPSLFPKTNHALTRLHTSYTSLPPLIRLPLSTFLTLLSYTPIIWFLQTHILQLMLVTGPSMYPFLNPDIDTSLRKDAVLVRMWRAAEDVRRGDVVVFRSPVHPGTLAVKRVIALEGDSVVPAPPSSGPPYPVRGEQEVSLGHVWVEGEYPGHARGSYDSNSYGAVSFPPLPNGGRKTLEAG
ncbi:MAG: hypothetical protein LQ344_003642 [Seirophora lacunosa]|nr:MAG: hypothetical protein LQ344_003642 [Seirophora lacunosa]